MPLLLLPLVRPAEVDEQKEMDALSDPDSGLDEQRGASDADDNPATLDEPGDHGDS
jgi:hypothetical protein